MNVRNFDPLTDRIELERIHKEHYIDEFSMIEFYQPGFLGSFVVSDSEKIVTIGGVRLLCEIVAVTDKDQSVKVRREALLNALQASEFISSRNGFSKMHAFVQDRAWLKQLLNHGFKHTVGASIIADTSRT